MSDQEDPRDEITPLPPWKSTPPQEEPESDVDEKKADVVPLPERGDTAPGVDLSDWVEMASAASDIEEFTSEEYLAATTQEYEGLREEIERAQQERYEQKAVSASIPGMDSGLVTFDDVTGRRSFTEEEIEHAEQAAASDLTMRIGSALVLVGLFLGSLVLGGWWFTSFVILVMVVALGELFATVRTAGYKPLAIAGLLGVVAMGIGAHNEGPMAIAGWAGFFTVATILFYSLNPRRRPLENVSMTVTGMAWVGMLATAILLAQGPRPVAWVLFAVAVIAGTDVGGYFVGRNFGRRPLAPRVSPHKTMEGLIGGLVTAVVVAGVLATFPAYESIGLFRALVIALVVAVVATLGDGAESVVKRGLGVKDMGSLLPGHGGMLDRIDGFLFGVPMVYLFFRVFELL